MVIDNTKVNKEVGVKPGDVVLLQGHKVNSLNLLHSGGLEVLFTDADVGGKTKEEILAASLRVCVLKGDYAFGEHGLVHATPEICTYRCVEEGKVSSYPYTKEQLPGVAKANPNLALYILKSLYRKVHLLLERVREVNGLLREALVFEDNLKVLTGDLVAKVPSSAVASFKAVADAARNASAVFAKNKGAGMRPGDVSFLAADHGGVLERNYDEALADTKTVVDMEMLSFFMGLLRVDAPVLAAQVANHPVLFKFPLEQLALMFDVLVQTVYEQERQFVESVDRVVGAQGLAGLWLALGPSVLAGSPLADEGVAGKVLETMGRLQAAADGMRTAPRAGLEGRLRTLFGQVAQAGKVQAVSASAGPVVDESVRAQLASLKGSVEQILEYSRMPEEDAALFRKALAAFKALPDKMDVSPEARRARHQLTRSYWQLFTHCFLRWLETRSAPLPVELMFKYGFLDETMLSEPNILFLLTARDDYAGTMDIYDVRRWLELIASEEKTPSITEMGLTFEKHLQEEAKTKTYAEMQELTQNPENLRRYKVGFEIQQMITSCARVCSESIATALPVLVDEILNLDIAKAFLYRQQIEDVVTEVVSIDPQVFNREVLVKTKFRMEIVEKGIPPDFIILPTVGSRVMMWQELEGSNKRSKARFVIPQFFLGDLRKNMILAFGRFRWEICKTQKGPQWADPIEGGITGYYFDYISFYKKNPNLSEEAKERIDEHVKNFRSNRERFAQDYLTYIEYESKGIAKLNKVLRDIFYRTMPFAKPIRDKLKTLPIYEPLETKYTNVLTRKLKDLEVKYRKYEKDPDGMPPELVEYLEMLKR